MVLNKRRITLNVVSFIAVATSVSRKRTDRQWCLNSRRLKHYLSSFIVVRTPIPRKCTDRFILRWTLWRERRRWEVRGSNYRRSQVWLDTGSTGMRALRLTSRFGHLTLNHHYCIPYKIACAPSEDSDQPAHPRSLIRVFAGHSVSSKWSRVIFVVYWENNFLYCWSNI